MFFILLTFCAALFIEGLGSLVSVIGISALFGANPIIIALAIALDVGKVVTVSLLYTYWKSLKPLMKAYALIAAAVTMTITSAGAAGYLSGEFQKAIMGTKEGETKVAILKEQQARYQARKNQIDDIIAHLPEKTTVNQRLRTVNSFKAEQQALDQKIAQIDQQLPTLQVAQIGTEAKAGPIMAIAKAFKVPVEQAVSWVIGMIIVVFDPLAIFLIIAGNFLVARRKAERKTEVVEERSSTIITDGNMSTPMRSGPEFPKHAIMGELFYRTDINQVFVMVNNEWKPVVSSEPVRRPLPEGPLVDPATIFPDPPETTYETYTPPQPPPPPDPVKEPEPVVEKVPNATTLAAMEEAEQIIQDRRTRMGTGILKPVNVTPPDSDEKIDRSNFTPLSVPEPIIEEEVVEPPQVIEPPHEEAVEPPREEISRSTLGLVPPDPHTVVDGRSNRSFRQADTIPK